MHEAFLTKLIFIFFYKNLSGLCTHPSIPQIFRATKITHKVALNPELSPGFCCPHGCSSHSLSQELLAIIVHVKLGFFFFPSPAQALSIGAKTDLICHFCRFTKIYGKLMGNLKYFSCAHHGLDGTTWASGKCPCPQQGVEKMDFKIFSDPNYSINHWLHFLQVGMQEKLGVGNKKKKGFLREKPQEHPRAGCKHHCWLWG